MTEGASRQEPPQPMVVEKLRLASSALVYAYKVERDNQTRKKILGLYVGVLRDMGGSPAGLSDKERARMIQKFQDQIDLYGIDRGKLVGAPTTRLGMEEEFEELGDAIRHLQGKIGKLEHPEKIEPPTMTQKLKRAVEVHENLGKAAEALKEEEARLRGLIGESGRGLGEEELKRLDEEMKIVVSHQKSLEEYRQELWGTAKAIEVEEEKARQAFEGELGDLFSTNSEAIRLTNAIARCSAASAKRQPEARVLLGNQIRTYQKELDDLKRSLAQPLAEKYNISMPATI